MKKIKRIIAMLCALFTMATISSCTFDFGFVDPDSSSSSKQEESSIVDITPPENNPQNSSSSDVNADMGGSEELKRSIKLAYARQLLSKVKEAELTRAERLQVEETERAFSLYLTKERWNTEDLRAVNDLCASLLKLSAKYAV